MASKDFLDSVNGAQAFCDLWVNMVVVCTLLLIESVLVFHHAARLIVPLICLLAAWGSLQQAKEAAVAWGRWVKSAFDISLPDLLKKLGFQSPSKITDIRKIWDAYSQTIVYNDPDWWATVDNFRADPSKPPGSPVSGGG